MSIITTLCNMMSGDTTEVYVRSMVEAIRQCEPDFEADKYFYDEDTKILSYEQKTYRFEKIEYQYKGLSLIKTVTTGEGANELVRKIWLLGSNKYDIEDLGLEYVQYIDFHNIPHVVGIYKGVNVVFVEAIPFDSNQKERVVRKTSFPNSKYQELSSKVDYELMLMYKDIYYSNELSESMEELGRI